MCACMCVCAYVCVCACMCVWTPDAFATPAAPSDAPAAAEGGATEATPTPAADTGAGGLQGVCVWMVCAGWECG